ncbi:MAG: VCBS repeat-containing protein, partial [Candidatus Stahlbacteria bacterium]|nr:VCBS repeat-containing protein [Candidatus Stahlbacteria bacterium]
MLRSLLAVMVVLLLGTLGARAQVTFTDVTAAAGISTGGPGYEAWGDYNNDGFQDLFFGGATCVLYRNNGQGTFTDVSISA